MVLIVGQARIAQLHDSETEMDARCVLKAQDSASLVKATCEMVRGSLVICNYEWFI